MDLITVSMWSIITVLADYFLKNMVDFGLFSQAWFGYFLMFQAIVVVVVAAANFEKILAGAGAIGQVLLGILKIVGR